MWNKHSTGLATFPCGAELPESCKCVHLCDSLRRSNNTVTQHFGCACSFSLNRFQSYSSPSGITLQPWVRSLSLVFPHTEYFTQKNDDALKLLPKNGSWPRFTFGSCKAVVWEMNCHGSKLCYCALPCCWPYRTAGHISPPLCLPWQHCSSRRDAAIVNTVLE